VNQDLKGIVAEEAALIAVDAAAVAAEEVAIVIVALVLLEINLFSTVFAFYRDFPL
jgi:hypothetical protein